VVTGCGAKFKVGAPTRHCPTTAFSKDETILWTRVLVEGGRCTIESFASSSDVRIDVATIRKSALLLSSGAPAAGERAPRAGSGAAAAPHRPGTEHEAAAERRRAARGRSVPPNGG